MPVVPGSPAPHRSPAGTVVPGRPPPRTALSSPSPRAPGPVTLVLDGPPAHPPAASSAAGEAVQLGRPLLLAHAAGHLPPPLDYAQRHAARRARQDAGQQVVADAARWVRRQLPGIPLETVVRLLDPEALVQAASRDACLVVRSS